MRNNLDIQYQNLLQDILENGIQKGDRTGTGTISVFGRQIRHKMSEGFPLITTKKMAWKSIVVELLWFLRGDTNIKYLVDNGCHIWNGDTYKNFTKKFNTTSVAKNSLFKMDKFIELIKTDDEFAKEWGDLGPIYGKQWRQWGGLQDIADDGTPIYLDQISNLINELKTNPDSRRLMVNAWNVGELGNMILPPCHYGFQVYTKELSARERTAIGSKGSTKLYDSIKEGGYNTIDADVEMHKVCDDINIPKRAISLMWNQRSVDAPLGLPFNIASYGLLLQLLAKELNMVADELIGNLGDTHIYLNQVQGCKYQIERTSYPLPQLITNDEFWNPEASFLKQIEHIVPDDFQIVDYQCHPAIKFPLSN